MCDYAVSMIKKGYDPTSAWIIGYIEDSLFEDIGIKSNFVILNGHTRQLSILTADYVMSVNSNSSNKLFNHRSLEIDAMVQDVYDNFLLDFFGTLKTLATRYSDLYFDTITAFIVPITDPISVFDTMLSSNAATPFDSAEVRAAIKRMVKSPSDVSVVANLVHKSFCKRKADANYIVQSGVMLKDVDIPDWAWYIQKLYNYIRNIYGKDFYNYLLDAEGSSFAKEMSEDIKSLVDLIKLIYSGDRLADIIFKEGILNDRPVEIPESDSDKYSEWFKFFNVTVNGDESYSEDANSTTEYRKKYLSAIQRINNSLVDTRLSVAEQSLENSIDALGIEGTHSVNAIFSHIKTSKNLFDIMCRILEERCELLEDWSNRYGVLLTRYNEETIASIKDLNKVNRCAISSDYCTAIVPTGHEVSPEIRFSVVTQKLIDFYSLKEYNLKKNIPFDDDLLDLNSETGFSKREKVARFANTTLVQLISEVRLLARFLPIINRDLSYLGYEFKICDNLKSILKQSGYLDE
jgi:hypothetical protein